MAHEQGWREAAGRETAAWACAKLADCASALVAGGQDANACMTALFPWPLMGDTTHQEEAALAAHQTRGSLMGGVGGSPGPWARVCATAELQTWR